MTSAQTPGNTTTTTVPGTNGSSGTNGASGPSGSASGAKGPSGSASGANPNPAAHASSPSAQPKPTNALGVPKGTLGDIKSNPVAGIKGLVRAQWDAGTHLVTPPGEKLAAKLPAWAAGTGKGLAKLGGRALPIVGSLVAAEKAWDDFHHGRPVSGFLNIIGMFPGPIGWLGMGGAWVANKLGANNFFHHHHDRWAAPNGSQTHMLPAQYAGDENVVTVDRALTEAQKAVFGFLDGPDGTVWNSNHPQALRVDATDVHQAITTWLTGIADQFQKIQTALGSSSEPYMQQYHQKLQPYLTAMSAATMNTHATQIDTQLKTASDAAGAWYEAVLTTNQEARAQLADGGALTNSAAGPLDDAARTNSAKIRAADAALSGYLANATLAPLAPVTRVAPAGKATVHDVTPPDAGVLAPASPAPPAPLPAPAAPAPAAALDSKKDNNLNDMLSALRNGTPNLGGSPLGGMPMGGMPNLGGMPMGGQPLGGGQPLATPPKPTPLAADTQKPKLASERPSLSGAPAENKTVPVVAEKKDGTVVPPAAAVPGAAASIGKPTDPAGAPKPAAAKAADDHTVDVKGKKIQFPDAKTAALAKELSAGAPGAPASLADAATKAGLVPPVPGQDPGQQVAPADAKPGDLLRAGNKDYLVLGNGDFLDFSSGKVLGADTMPKDLGVNGGYFHLHDSAGAQPAGPVSGQVPDTTTFAVDQQPKLPADAGTPTPAGAVDGPAAATTPPVPPAGSGGGVTSTGSPGVPAGGTGTGPSNTASTDTGRGVGIPSTSTKPLDPTAIK